MSRYVCNECGSFVKDKFIFGLLHVCEPLVVPRQTQTYMNNLAKKHPMISQPFKPTQSKERKLFE